MNKKVLDSKSCKRLLRPGAKLRYIEQEVPKAYIWNGPVVMGFLEWHGGLEFPIYNISNETYTVANALTIDLTRSDPKLLNEYSRIKERSHLEYDEDCFFYKEAAMALYTLSVFFSRYAQDLLNGDLQRFNHLFKPAFAEDMDELRTNIEGPEI